MPWFFSRNRKPNDKTISLWVGSIRTSADREQFQLFLKQNQQDLMNGIAAEVLPLSGETDPEVAYLLVHFLSGRAFLPAFKDVLDLHPKSSEKASKLYKIVLENGLSDTLKAVSVMTCSLEITNECKERHYEESYRIANHGIALWPDVGELWRQRGVVGLVLGDYIGADEDLNRAQALNPAMLWLSEPMVAVRGLLRTLPSEKQSPAETPNSFILVPPGYGPLVRKALWPPLRASFANAEGMKFADFRPLTSGAELRWYHGPDRRSEYSLVNITFGVGTFTEGALYKELTEWAINSEGRAEYERKKREVQGWGMAYPEPVSKNNNFELTVRLRVDEATAEPIPVIAPEPRS